MPARIRETLKGDLVRQEVVVGLLNMLFLGLFLSQGSDPAAQAEAESHAHEAMATGAEVPLIQGLGALVLGQVKLQRGEDAEGEARTALHMLTQIALWLPAAQALLMRALLAQSRAAAAVPVAQEALELLKRFGGVGFLEVELRLAISEAFFANGDIARAETELRETLRQIQLRADDITDAFWKNSYLSRNPHCVRALQRAKQWGLGARTA